ncbi:MAG: dihydroorotate dehydrogenase, partial [Planctomycetia bacterium]|nr:dihydroorotate dehydrogenase [Planctomycetia bacterium]
MTDLTTQYLGLKLRSPIVLASAGPSTTADMIKRAEDMGVGAVAMKGTYDVEAMWRSPTPRFRVIRRRLGTHSSSTFYCYEQGTGIRAEDYPKEIERAKNLCSIPVFANIVCQDIANWQRFIREAQDAGADAIEVNVSCPHGSLTTVGGEVEKNIVETLGLVMEVARVPISLKISPQLTSPLAVVLAAQKCGVKGAVLFNRSTGLEINLETEQPIMHGGYAGHGGPWAIHYVVRWHSEISPLAKIDLCAS